MSKKTQPNISPIEQKVMGKIKKGEAHMKPQSYYLFLGMFGVLSVLLLGFITSYFMSIATLWMRIRLAPGPAYGAKQNMSNLIGTFPWWALLLGAFSLICIIYLIKKAGLLYKIRLLYLVPAIVALFIIVGFVLSYSSLPEMFNMHGQDSGCLNGYSECITPGGRYIRNR